MSEGYRRSQGEDRGLIHAYDEEESTGFGLADLASSDEEEHEHMGNGNAKKIYANGNGSASKRSFTEPIERERSISRRNSPLPR